MKNLNILDISIYQMQLFLTLAQVRNFSRAASIVNIAQPTLSIRISSLESHIGVKLFDRDKRPIELTHSGMLLYDEWTSVVKKIERSIEGARMLSNNANNRLVVSTMDSTRRFFAMEIVATELERQHGGLQVSTECSPLHDWKKRLQAREIDIMLTITLEKPFIDEELYETEETLTCPKLVCMLKNNPLSKKKNITFEDLKDQQFILNSPQVFPAHYEFVRRSCKKYGYEPYVSRYVGNPHSLIWSLKADNEVIICDMFLRDVESPHIRRFELPGSEGGLLAVWRKGDTNPWIMEYITAIKKAFADVPPTIEDSSYEERSGGYGGRREQA